MIDNPHRRQKKYVNEVKDYITIAIAMIIGSVGWVVFLLPNKITTGGVAGIASIVYWGTGIPVQIPYFAINALLLLAALKVLGWKFCVKTIYAVTVFTLAVSVLQQLTEGVHLLADQPFMATIAGGCFLGISVGLGLCCNGSTGGSDVVAAIVNKYRDISLGHAILLCDMAIVTSSYFVLKDWEQVIYGYVVLVIVSICVDRVVNSMRSSIQLFIISEKPEEIGRLINAEAQRGCTIINGQGFFSGAQTKILFVLARQSESKRIFQIIDEVDPHAFVSSSAVIGVYGNGFDPFKVKHSQPHEQSAMAEKPTRQ